MERRTFLRSLMTGVSAAAGTALAYETRADDTTADASTGPNGATLTTEIEALLRETEAIWDSQDTARLRELWDTDDVEPYYLAGEQENWFIGWDAIDAYLAPPRGAPKITQAIRVRFYDVRARWLAPDLAFAAYWMRTDMKLVFQAKPFGSDNRVASVFRKKPEGWKYVCYTEAFQTPNLYIQKLYEKDISPEYEAFYNQMMKKPG